MKESGLTQGDRIIGSWRGRSSKYNLSKLKLVLVLVLVLGLILRG